MNDLMKYDYPQLTGSIFHYTSVSGLMGILDSNTIWATNIFYLNDFAELVLAIKRVQDQIPYLQEHIPKEDCDFLDEFGKHLGEITQKFSIRLFDLSQMVYVCCFSSNPNQLSQWRGYCPEGNGYSVGFEFIGSLYDRVINRQRFSLRKCLYTEEEHREFVLLFLKHALGIFHQMKTHPGSGDQDSTFYAAIQSRMDFLEYAPMLKHEKFKEEAEVRLISRPGSVPQEAVQFRKGKSVIIPYLTIALADKAERLPLSKIIIGPTPYPELSQKSLQSLLAIKGYDPSLTEISGIPYRGGGLQI